MLFAAINAVLSDTKERVASYLIWSLTNRNGRITEQLNNHKTRILQLLVVKQEE